MSKCCGRGFCSHKFVYAAIAIAVIAFISVAWSSWAHAGTVSIVSETPMYKTERLYENVEVCTDRGDNVLPGLILGGIVGNNTGNGSSAEGALVGGLLGALSSGESCKIERRQSGTRQIYTHTRYEILLNGVRHVINQ